MLKHQLTAETMDPDGELDSSDGVTNDNNEAKFKTNNKTDLDFGDLEEELDKFSLSLDEGKTKLSPSSSLLNNQSRLHHHSE